MDTVTPKRKMRIPRLTTEEMAAKRRVNKPLTEKRRRERINNYLDQLKHIVLHRTNKEGSDSSRLEKTDILEMTVNYLQSSVSTDLGNKGQYREGFQTCMSEVFRFLSYAPTVTNDTKMQLYCHLSGLLASKEKTSFQNIRPQHPPQLQALPLGSPASFSTGSISPVGTDDSGIDFNQSGTLTPFRTTPVAARDVNDHYTLGNLSSFSSVHSVPSHAAHYTPLSAQPHAAHCTPSGFDMSRMDWNRDDSIGNCTVANNSCLEDKHGGPKPTSDSPKSMWRPW